MTEPKPAVAESLAVKAQRLSADGDYEAAEQLHRQAIRLCGEVYEATTSDRAAHHQAAQALADQCGRLGGTLRCGGHLSDALAAYDAGARLERDWRLDATYNRTNKITIELLLDPSRLPLLAGELLDVLELLESQVEGPRRRELWAWADLGLLSLVAVRDRAAMRAYANLVDLGPERVFVESVLEVLKEVRDKVVSVSPGRSWAFETVIRQVESAVG